MTTILCGWTITLTAPDFCWTKEFFIIAPTAEHALRTVAPLVESWQKESRVRIDFRITKIERGPEVDAIWEPPQVIPTRPTVEQQATAEVERLLETT